MEDKTDEAKIAEIEEKRINFKKSTKKEEE